MKKKDPKVMLAACKLVSIVVVMQCRQLCVNPAHPPSHVCALSATRCRSPEQFLGGGLFLQSQDERTAEKD